jgi:cyclopropane fatty-acyl-phospholipid synthase-like methyltransferase
MVDQNKLERFAERYEKGEVPWDQELPPPEVIELVERLAPGRGLDLGCGYGRTCIYFAQYGWMMDGVDFVSHAISEARRRAEKMNVATAVRFFQNSVTELSFLSDVYDLAIDVGCMHSFSHAQLIRYHAELKRLLPVGAQFLLYARIIKEDSEPTNGPQGVAETAVRDLFADGFWLERFEPGMTQVEDQPAWHSAWFWFKRIGG